MTKFANFRANLIEFHFQISHSRLYSVPIRLTDMVFKTFNDITSVSTIIVT